MVKKGEKVGAPFVKEKVLAVKYFLGILTVCDFYDESATMMLRVSQSCPPTPLLPTPSPSSPTLFSPFLCRVSLFIYLNLVIACFFVSIQPSVQKMKRNVVASPSNSLMRVNAMDYTEGDKMYV